MRVPQWTIKARLILTLGLACSLLAAVGVMGVRDQQHSNIALRDMYINKLVPAIQLGKLLESYGSDRAAVLRAASSHNAALVQKAEQEVSKDREAQAAEWKRISAVDFSAKERTIAKRFSTNRAQLEHATGAALSAMQASNYKGAETIMDGSAETHYQAVKGDVLKLFDLQSSASAKSYHADEARAHLSKILSLSAIGTGLGASLLLSILLIRSLTRSLGTAVRVADSIAGGQLNNRIEIRSDDELGRLLKALQRMDHQLAEIVGEVNRGSSAVSVAAGQIAQGTDDLSQRTQEQASSLEETAASMEEMTSTVKHNADNAAQADQLARGARRQAEEGGEVVREAVDAMTAVSESSKRIADIVGLIDEIAFQTNLLSLNAAVEAARAGEQGRGFAVVATEVRNLAQRSANAAREIKTLITDSVERVRVGQGLVDRSGVTLSEIVESVKKVTDIVAEMAAASAEQSTGIDQVNTAVMTMDEVTQQNSALVEESAAASRAMQEQADALLKTVGYFRFDERAAGQAGATAASSQASAASAHAAHPAGEPVRDEHGQAVARMVEEALVAS